MIETILRKFNEAPGHCSTDELYKIRAFYSNYLECISLHLKGKTNGTKEISEYQKIGDYNVVHGILDSTNWYIERELSIIKSMFEAFKNDKNILNDFEYPNNSEIVYLKHILKAKSKEEIKNDLLLAYGDKSVVYKEFLEITK